MNESLHNDEILVRYLDGELNEAEKNELEARLKSDPALQQELESLRVTIEAVKQAGTAEKIRSMHKSLLAEQRKERAASPVRRMVRIGMAVAAVLVLAVSVLGIYTYQLSAGRIYDEHFLNFSTSASRGVDHQPSPTQSLYAEGRYQEVVEADTAARDSYDRLLLALSHLHLSQPLPAIDILLTLQQDQRYGLDAEYYLAMAYLKNNEPAPAYALLEKIHEDEKHPYHLQVSAGLVRKLKLLRWRTT